MTEISKAFRLYFARGFAVSVLRVYTAVILFYAAVAAVGAVLNAVKGSPEHLRGFIAGAAPFCSIMSAFVPEVMLANAYSYNNLITPGYRYFHSIDPNGSIFRHAILAANILILLTAIPVVVINAAVNYLADMELHWFAASVFLIIAGAMNFMGYIKSQLGRIAAMVGICVATGVITGFSSGMTDEGEPLPLLFYVIMTAVSALIYAASAVYSARASIRKWRDT